MILFPIFKVLFDHSGFITFKNFGLDFIFVKNIENISFYSFNTLFSKFLNHLNCLELIFFDFFNEFSEIQLFFFPFELKKFLCLKKTLKVFFHEFFLIKLFDKFICLIILFFFSVFDFIVLLQMNDKLFFRLNFYDLMKLFEFFIHF